MQRATRICGGESLYQRPVLEMHRKLLAEYVEQRIPDTPDGAAMEARMLTENAVVVYDHAVLHREELGAARG